MTRKSRTVRPSSAVESPAVRSLPLVDVLVDTKAEFLELMVRSGLRVLDAMLKIARPSVGHDMRIPRCATVARAERGGARRP